MRCDSEQPLDTLNGIIGWVSSISQLLFIVIP